MKNNKLIEYLAFGFVLILAEISAFSHLRFSIAYDHIFGRDWQIHLINTFKIYHCHFDLTKILLWYKNSVSNIAHYPPFNYLISAAFWEFLKLPPLAAAYASKVVWIFFGSLALYGAGRALGKSVCAGIVAAILGILNGLMLEMAADVSLEFVVPASFALVVYGYVLSYGYQRMFGSVILGLLLGIGLLSKTVLFIFAAPFLVFGFFFTPFEIESRFIKRFLYASLAATIAFGIASFYYIPLFPELLHEARIESRLSHVEKNLSNIFSYSFPFVITPFTLMLAVAAITLQIRKRLSFLIPPIATLIISSAYMMTLQTLGSTYMLTFGTILVLMTVSSFKYIKSALRIALTALIIILFYIPTLTGKTYTENRLVNRFFYPYDKWETRSIVVPRYGRDCDWELVERFALLFKNRYADYGYRDIGYILAAGMIHLPNMALALVKQDEAWLEDLDWREVINIGSAGSDYNEDEMNTIRKRKLVILSLPENATGKSYELLHEIYNALENERAIDFSFPMSWGFDLPGDFKILLLTKR